MCTFHSLVLFYTFYKTCIELKMLPLFAAERNTTTGPYNQDCNSYTRFSNPCSFQWLEVVGKVPKTKLRTTKEMSALISSILLNLDLSYNYFIKTYTRKFTAQISLKSKFHLQHPSRFINTLIQKRKKFLGPICVSKPQSIIH